MDIKPRPNHKKYLEILRAMTPAQRLERAFALTEFSRRLMKDGIRRRNPLASEADLHRIYLARLEKCHNQNY